MKILPVYSNACFPNKNTDMRCSSSVCRNSSQKTYANALEATANYNKGLINFNGYYGDNQPAKKLFWILKGNNDVYEDNDTYRHLYRGGNTGWKKWVSKNPEDLLKQSPLNAVQSICTLNKKNNCYPGIPSYIPTPDYGDKWGRRANYIEINPRTIALTQGDQKREGLLNLIKLLPAIPPSSKSFANCVVLSQLYPAMGNWNDGKTGPSSLYTVNLHAGISKNLTSDGLWRDGQHLGDDEQVKAFNDLAHLRGLKTGFRMPLSAGQMTVQGRGFDWYNDENAFIDACCWAVDLGFDSIFFDSAKHIGNYDMGNYCGVGALPNFKQMQYITTEIRKRTGRNDIALIGEKCNDDDRFKKMGLSAGTDWGRADDFSSVMHEYDKQRHSDEYAAGPMVSDDNDTGHMPFEQRLNRLKNSFHAHRETGFKLPTFMQMHDIFPLNPYTSTHAQMEESRNLSAYGDVDSHYNNIFNTSDTAKWFKDAVYNEFLHVMYN
ncbi:MAG: hypothetical protein PHX18_06380 [Candidatus Gastranaerophilales bacterium]|nr:hypothetical protein [Candidatus Gastranaerophilales bacterium]